MTGKGSGICAVPHCGEATKGERQPLCWNHFQATPVELRGAHSGAARRVTNREKKIRKLEGELAQARKDKAAALDAVVGYWL